MSSRLLTKMLFLAVLATGFATAESSAQMMASERSQIHQKINGVDVVIDYSRPSVRGRLPIWGGIEPWDILWTPGANASTTFKFSEDVKLNGAEVAAGKYSVWFELLENDPWSLVLFTDTTAFHVPYPSKDSSHVAVGITPEEAPSFVETLRFDIENVRVDGADIEFRWGNTLIPIRLDVDPGYDMVFDANEAERYVGDWVLDTSMARPADSLIVEWRKDMPEEQIEDFENWLLGFSADLKVRIVHDAETGHLLGYRPTVAELRGDDPDEVAFVMIREAEGIFIEGVLEDGELMFVFDWTLWEFDFDDDGRASDYVLRAKRNDEVEGRAVRGGAGR